MDWKTVVLNPKQENNDFAKEKDLQFFIGENIEEFTKEVLGDIYISHQMEKPTVTIRRFGPRGKRVDIYIKGKEQDYVVELKNPKHLSEVKSGIGQLLGYGLSFKNAKMILVSTKFDLETGQMIKYYNLPIDYYYFSKDCVLKYQGDAIYE